MVRSFVRIFAAIMVWATLGATAHAQTDADIISQNVLGPRVPIDLAYGAFQRGQYLTALALAIERASQDKTDAAAQTLIGLLYENGFGVSPDAEAAASFYQIGTNNGDANAAFALASMYQEGRGIARNRAKSAELIKLAAEKGHPGAIYNLALLHVEGQFASPSLAAAIELMEQAALASLPEAQYDFGTMLLEGAGAAPDAEAGAEQIGLAAETGLPSAQVDYATLLYLGRGVTQNRVEAAKWYQRAANSGNAVAQNRLAKLLAVGENIEQDVETAAMWRALSGRLGLIDPVLDSLLQSVPRDIIQKAEERARYWPAAAPSTDNTPTLLPANIDDDMHKAMLALIEQGLIDEALLLPHSAADDADPFMQQQVQEGTQEGTQERTQQQTQDPVTVDTTNSIIVSPAAPNTN